MRLVISILFRTARFLLWTQAIFAGRIGQRLINVVIGRGAGRLLARLWR